MATFNKFENQETRSLSVKLASGTGTWDVGDVFSYVPSTGVGAKLSYIADITTAFAAGYEVYMIAQGDMITKGTPTSYKNYNIGSTVDMTTAATPVVAYVVLDANNINGLPLTS